jgi:phosphate transport system protein
MTGSDARKTFDHDLNSLQEDILHMGAVVEEMLGKSMRALENRDVKLARQVEDMDDVVDRYNLDIEAHALRLLALQQPIARDLRTIAAAMKIITDVERAGDYAVDISKIAERLANEEIFKPLQDLPRMARIVQEMLRETLRAFVSRDLAMVAQMISHDDEVDATYRKLYDELIAYVKKNPAITDQAVGLLLIATHLERIADHITNIGERIHYMETGELKELHK